MMIIAERGGMDLGPENTLYAIEQSLEAGATAIHATIRTSMDDLPVLMHDATVNRTTKGEGDIYRMNLGVIKRLETKDGIKVPSLQQVLEALLGAKCNIVLELPHPATTLPTAELIDHYQRKKGYVQGRIIVASKYHQLVTLVHDKYPHILTAAMVTEIPESLAACGEYTKSNYIIAPISNINNAFMEDAQKRNVMVIASGCNDHGKIERSKTLQTHGLITPNPRLAI